MQDESSFFFFSILLLLILLSSLISSTFNFTIAFSVCYLRTVAVSGSGVLTATGGERTESGSDPPQQQHQLRALYTHRGFRDSPLRPGRREARRCPLRRLTPTAPPSQVPDPRRRLHACRWVGATPGLAAGNHLWGSSHRKSQGPPVLRFSISYII